MRFLKKTAAPKLILACLITSISYVLLYELVFTLWPSYNQTIYKLGVITTRIMYSIMATSIFYFISQYFPIYLPREKKKMRVLFTVYHKILILNTLIEILKHNLSFRGDIFNESNKFKIAIQKINPDQPVASFHNWYSYLGDLKQKLMDIVNSIIIYNEYINHEILQEITLIEQHLYTPHAFDDHKTLQSNDLSYAQFPIVEILVHTHILSELNEKEYKKNEQTFLAEAKVYVSSNYENIIIKGTE